MRRHQICETTFSEPRTRQRRGIMFLLIGVFVLTYWGCESSNDSDPSRVTEGDGSGLRLEVQMPLGSDPSLIDRFEISVTGPGIPLYTRNSVGTRIAVGTLPGSVALGHLNGDRALDVVAANVSPNTVSVLLGRGDGSFLAEKVFSVRDSSADGDGGEPGPQVVALGDTNGDGVLDVVTANLGTNNVSVLLGDGEGRFMAAKAFRVGDGPRSVALGDVDGDDVLDAVTANRLSNDVFILFGTGDGAFSADQIVGADPRSVALGDVNDDDVLDVITANFDSDNVSILLGDGEGSFMAAKAFRVGDAPRSVALGDFNGGDVLDVVTANEGSNDVSILLGTGNGSFMAAATLRVGDAPRSVALGDVDNDDVLDVGPRSWDRPLGSHQTSAK